MRNTSHPNQDNYLSLAWATPWRVTNELKRLVAQPFAQLLFIFYGVPWHRTYRLYGVPLLQLWRGSKVLIGEGLELRSSVGSNPLSPYHPVVFATRSPQAILTIGRDFKMTGGSLIAERSITIGNNVMVGANSTIIDTDFHPLQARNRKSNPIKGKTLPVVIEDNVFIGTQCIVLKGVTIGKGSVIGAGSVVTKNVPRTSIAVGNPAKVVAQLK